MDNNSCFYNKLSLLSIDELKFLLDEIMREVGEKLSNLKSTNKNVGKILDNSHYCNTIFEDVEVIEYNLDVFFEKYKLIKQKISNARLVNLKLNELAHNEDIPEELARIGCKKILSIQ